MLDAQEQSRLNNYQGYYGLPPLAGLLSMSDAITKGLPVAKCTARLKRTHWALRAAHQILMAHIASIPIYELKMAFSLHAHYCAEHVEAIATRIREMRQPPCGLDVIPTPQLKLLHDEILAAPTTAALLLGLYEVLFPEIQIALQALLTSTNKLFDHPTYRVCRFALLEVEEVNAYGSEVLQTMVTAQDREPCASWLKLLRAALAASGGLDGTAPMEPAELTPQFSLQSFVYDGVPQRDERFQDSYNMGVNAEAILFDSEIAPLPKTLMLFFKRMREIDVPEMMSSIIFETKGKPWSYYRDMTRQLWDEARHAMMGEIGFVSLGIDWTKIPFNFTGSRNLNERLNPLERHAVLYTIEQGLMPKRTGKQYEWEVAVASASPLSQLIQDYDWADEVLHARIGRDWLVPGIGTQQQALAFGDEAWSRGMTGWAELREQGLTQHRNWWPELYNEACRHWRIQPDPKLLALHVTYEGIRADQKHVPA